MGMVTGYGRVRVSPTMLHLKRLASGTLIEESRRVAHHVDHDAIWVNQEKAPNTPECSEAHRRRLRGARLASVAAPAPRLRARPREAGTSPLNRLLGDLAHEPSGLILVSVAIQLISQVLPPSSEKACSKWQELGVISEITNLTSIARPLYVSWS